MPSTIELKQLPKQAPSLKQTQRLIMSPQMQQALTLLQLPVMELTTLIEAEMEQNPILEYSQDAPKEEDEKAAEENESEKQEEANPTDEKELSFDDKNFEILKQLDEEFRDHFAESGAPPVRQSKDESKRRTYLESSIRQEMSLFEFLMHQAEETFQSEEAKKMAETIIGNIDSGGFLTTPLSEIAKLNNLKEEDLAELLKEIQEFEPYGIAASNLQESLLIQLRCLDKKHTLAYKIVENHFEDLIHNRIPLIQKDLSCTSHEIEEAIDRHISRLDLHPGSWCSKQLIQYITPDVTIKQEGEELQVVVNDDYIPSLRLNTKYLRMLDDETLSAESKEFIRSKVVSAKWLMRNLTQRNDTLFRIAESLAKTQRDFFLNPEGQLVPLTMKVLAEELSLHESTIARAVSNKYVDTPKGILALRSFFTNAYMTEKGSDISSNSVRDALKEIIEHENKAKPFSDAALSSILKEKGIPCARRTIAKYRAELNFGNAQQRRKYE